MNNSNAMQRPTWFALTLSLLILGLVFVSQATAGPVCPGGTVIKYQGDIKGCLYNTWNSTAQDACNGNTYLAPTAGGTCHVCINPSLVSTILDKSQWSNFTPSNFDCMAGQGMTWAKLSHNSTYGTDKVGCNGCNAYVGDTSCMEELPVLCLKKDGSANPGLSTGFYNGWAQGHIGLSVPVLGRDLTSVAAANAVCQAQFGSGYVMGEFHDGGGGWNWNAYGNVANWPRFWTRINNQPANCWN